MYIQYKTLYAVVRCSNRFLSDIEHMPGKQNLKLYHFFTLFEICQYKKWPYNIVFSFLLFKKQNKTKIANIFLLQNGTYSFNMALYEKVIFTI